MSRLPFDPRPNSRCRLVLHLHRADSLMHAVRTIMELTRFCREEATQKMWLAYHHGQSVLLTLHRERAELLAERFSERGLTVVLESLSELASGGR